MKQLLLCSAVLGVTLSLQYGPCRKVRSVDIDLSKWTQKMYVNVMSNNADVHCFGVNRYLIYNGSETLIGEQVGYIENNIEVNHTLSAKHVDPGHYRIQVELIAGTISTVEVFFLYFDVPQLECHYGCSNDEIFKNGNGTVFCESKYPYAAKENASQIKKVLEENGFCLSDLQIIENCHCTNIPFASESDSCKTVSLEEYFS